MKKTDCWIIIAAHDEERHVADVVLRCRKQGMRNVVVVDDGSTDRTAERAERAGATVLQHLINLGKGAAMKTGAEYALTRNAKAIIFLDGDGQHRPEEVGRFLKALDRYDAVFSYRRETHRMPLVRRLGRWIISTILRLFYNMRLHDNLCGYRALTARAYRRVRWESKRYNVESEMVARVGRFCLTYTEVPISTIYHDKYKGMTFLDGFSLMWNLIWWRMTW